MQTKDHFSGVYLTFRNITAHNRSFLYCKCLELMLALTKAMHHPSLCIIKSRGKPSKISHHMQQCGTISQPPSIVTRTLTCDQLKKQKCSESTKSVKLPCRIGCMFLTTPTSMQNNSDNNNVSVSKKIILQMQYFRSNKCFIYYISFIHSYS